MGGQPHLGGRADPHLYQQSDPNLANSIHAQQANGIPIPFGHQIPPYIENESGFPQNMRETFPTTDSGYAAQLDSKYGSPQEPYRNQLPPVSHLSVLDVPMPASFDSQGVSHIAKHGRFGSSVPSKFGLDSPPSSLPERSTPHNDAVRHLHSSVWGREERTKGLDLGSSPIGSGDEGFGQRIMHSKRAVKTGFMSASLPRQRFHINDDDEEGFAFSGEEDFIPGNLQDIVLTPEERKRRKSRTEQESRPFRDGFPSLGSPSDGNSKVGSPAAASSPSRYGAFFAARQKQEEAHNNFLPSGFGHVGSPLRNSSLQHMASPLFRATEVSSDVPPAFASPNGRTSVISQLLARARLNDSNDIPANSSSNALNHTSLQRNPSSSSHLAANRTVSSTSLGGTGRINEEQDGIFPMEEEDDEHRKRARDDRDHRNRYAHQGRDPASRKASPKPAPIGSRRGFSFGLV